MFELNYTEIYRQNYQDALDEIHKLRTRVKELEIENQNLRENKNHTDYILENYRHFYKKSIDNKIQQ